MKFRFLKKSANKEEFLPALVFLFPSSLGNVPSPCSHVSPRAIYLNSHNPLPKRASCWETILLSSGATRLAFLLHQTFAGFVMICFAQFRKIRFFLSSPNLLSRSTPIFARLEGFHNGSFPFCVFLPPSLLSFQGNRVTYEALRALLFKGKGMLSTFSNPIAKHSSIIFHLMQPQNGRGLITNWCKWGRHQLGMTFLSLLHNKIHPSSCSVHFPLTSPCFHTWIQIPGLRIGFAVPAPRQCWAREGENVSLP